MEDWGKDWDMESWDDEVGSWNTKIHIKYKILYRKYKKRKYKIQNTNSQHKTKIKLQQK